MDLRQRYLRQLREQGYQADPVQEAVIARLDALRTRLIAAHARRARPLHRLLQALRAVQPPAVRGLYLWGGVGRGKTWMMDLFYRSLPFAQRRRRHFHRFMHDVHASLKQLPEHAAPLDVIAARLARETQVLCFDELFVSDIADAMILGGLFAALFRRGVTLVATSNSPPGDLYRGGLQRQRFVPTIELLEQHMDVVAVDGPRDYRLRQLTQAGIYLAADDPTTPARLRALFDELAQGEIAVDEDGPHPTSIEVEGRAIPVVREAGGVVWFEFRAICAGPRSTDDYLEIARNYQSVIVAGIPVFDESLENEARRFIALVDELYDRRVKLIVSAASPPQELYRGSLLAAPFARTVSRLVEMQSTPYLASEHRP